MGDSIMPIQINGATSGGATLQSTDATSPTLTLPANTGTLLSTANPQSGGVIQVVNATTGTTVSSTTNSFVDTTLTATITPKFATSKILIFVHQNGIMKNGSSVNEDMALILLRNGVNLCGISLYSFYTGTSIQIRGQTLSTSYLDSPATTSALTYKTQFKDTDAGGTVTVQNEGSSALSTITLMEIAA